MANQSIMQKLVNAGIPIEKAADLTVRCITNRNGKVRQKDNESTNGRGVDPVKAARKADRIIARRNQQQTQNNGTEQNS